MVPSISVIGVDFASARVHSFHIDCKQDNTLALASTIDTAERCMDSLRLRNKEQKILFERRASYALDRMPGVAKPKRLLFDFVFIVILRTWSAKLYHHKETWKSADLTLIGRKNGELSILLDSSDITLDGLESRIFSIING